MKKGNYKFLRKGLAWMVTLVLCMQMGVVSASADSKPSVEYSLHIQDKGWLDYVRNGATGGTTGKSVRAEAIKIRITGMAGGITYRTHIQDDGWTSWKSDNAQSGSTGRNLRMEAIEMKLTGEIATKYDVYYRAHVGEVGWLGWTKNGGLAGSTGCGLRMEAIEIKLSLKTKRLRTSQSSVSKPVLKVKAHVQDDGWLKEVGEEQTAGTTGKGYRMEALQIQCPDFLGGNGILYRAHMEDEGWQDWKTTGKTAGTYGKSKRMEAVEIKLTGAISGVYDVYYRAHCADYGWLGWARNGETAGTTGGSKQMEAIEIKLVEKTKSVDKGGKAYHDLTGTANNNQSNQRPIKVFSQTDRDWADVSYGKGPDGERTTVSKAGCGILSYVNAVYYMTGNFIQPSELAEWSVNHGYRVNGKGTSWGLYQAYANANGEAYGFRYSGKVSSVGAARSHLQGGGTAVISLPDHLMALVAYDNGKYLVLDSLKSSNRGTYQTGYRWMTESQFTGRLRVSAVFLLSKR